LPPLSLVVLSALRKGGENVCFNPHFTDFSSGHSYMFVNAHDKDQDLIDVKNLD